MEELNLTVTYYRAFCNIGWMWIFPVEDVPFQEHKAHYLSAIKWCDDKNISNLLSDNSSTYEVYVRRTTIMFTNEEDAIAFKLAYGNLILYFVVEP